MSCSCCDFNAVLGSGVLRWHMVHLVLVEQDVLCVPWGVYSHLIYVTCSVPQGSVLGPLMFLLYTAELAEFAARYGVTLHSFADDNQLHIHCRINDVHLPVADLEHCVTTIGHWMSANRLKLNTDNTELIWNGTKTW